MKSWRQGIEYAAVKLLQGFILILPRRVAGAFGACLGNVIYFIGIRRDVTEANLRAAFPTLPPRAIRAVTRRVYRHLGRVAVGSAWVPHIKSDALDRWIFVKGRQVLDDVLSRGKGAIIVSGHFGNWELMGGIMTALGYPATYVVTTQRNKRIEVLIDGLRMSAGIEVVKVREGVRGVLSALKRNRFVAMMIDQDAHEAGVFVPFFGRDASAPKGPASFHLKTGCPLIFAYSLRIPGERYIINIEELDTSNLRPRDATTVTALATEKLEQAIRETPEQWLWMHRRWKTRPPAS